MATSTSVVFGSQIVRGMNHFSMDCTAHPVNSQPDYLDPLPTWMQPGSTWSPGFKCWTVNTFCQPLWSVWDTLLVARQFCAPKYNVPINQEPVLGGFFCPVWRHPPDNGRWQNSIKKVKVENAPNKLCPVLSLSLFRPCSFCFVIFSSVLDKESNDLKVLAFV